MSQLGHHQNHRAQLASAYNELGKELSSQKIRVVGNYTLGKVIGEGAYGKVRLGTHRMTSMRVAIKQIPKAMSAALTREIHHHRQLHHPHVVQLYEVIATEHAIWLVAELCSGGELFDYLLEKGRLSDDEARIVFGQLCLAVGYCHDKGIVHRDLKLENVLLDERCRVKLSDFGFTREYERGALLETWCGTTGYAAPEMLSEQKYLGPEVDIWSLGIILYTLLTGALPFDDDDEAVMREKIIKGEFEDPEWLSDEARDLIKNVLQMEPGKRLTMSQILAHPWFTSRVQSPISPPSFNTDVFGATPASAPPLESAESAETDASFQSASSDWPTTPDDGEPPPMHRSGSDSTLKRTATIHETLEETPEKAPRPANVRTNSKGPPPVGTRTPARTKRRSVSSALSETLSLPDAPLEPQAPQDFSALLTTPAPVIFSTPHERQLLNGLSALGFDTAQMVHSVLTDACDATGAVWWMLKRKAEKKAVEAGETGKLVAEETPLMPSVSLEDAVEEKSGERRSGEKKEKKGPPAHVKTGSVGSLFAAQSAPNLHFVPATPTVGEHAPKTPPRADSPSQPMLTPSASIISTNSTPGAGGSKEEKQGSKGRRDSKGRNRSGSVSIMQRATTALEAAGLVRKKSTEAVRELQERDRERALSPEGSLHGSGSKLSKSPPLKAFKDALMPSTPSASVDSEEARPQLTSPWVNVKSNGASPHGTPTTSPGDTLTSLPHISDKANRNRASLLTAFRTWFDADRKGKRKSAAVPNGAGYQRSASSPVITTSGRGTVKRRTSSGGSQAVPTRKTMRGNKRASASSRRSSSVNSRRSSVTSMHVVLEQSPSYFEQRAARSSRRGSYGAATPTSERGDYPSRPSSVRSFSQHGGRHRKSPSQSSAGSANMRTASPLPRNHKRVGSGGSTRVRRTQTPQTGRAAARPAHARSSSAASVYSLASSRHGSLYDLSESEGPGRTASPYRRARRSLDEGPRKTTHIAQKRTTPFMSPAATLGRSSWKKSWGLEPPGWQSRSMHVPIEVLAISPVPGDAPASLRDVFSGRQSLTRDMGDESDWVDEDDDEMPFAGGLGQVPTSAQTFGLGASDVEQYVLPPLPNKGKGRATASTSKRQNAGRAKSSPVGRNAPLAPEHDAADVRGTRRGLPAARMSMPIQEEEEEE